MILQALQEYYQKLQIESKQKIPAFGFSNEKIHFALILDEQGTLVDVEDLRERDGKKTFPRLLTVPQGEKRTVGISPNFMWDNSSYVLGVADDQKDPQRSIQQFEAFRQFHHNLGKCVQDVVMQALIKFLDHWNPKQPYKFRYWDEVLGKNIVFKFDSSREYFHDHPVIQAVWANYLQQRECTEKSVCLVTGKKAPIARLHSSIKGVKDAQSSGASLVTFNLDAFCSYEKTQGLNAPVSILSSFEYTTALNYLLNKESQQKIQIGDCSTIFWSTQENVIEDKLGDILNAEKNAETETFVFTNKELEDSQQKDIKEFLETVRAGEMPRGIGPNIPFYILGLAPNAARLSVRFWHVSTVEDILCKIVQHFQDMAIEMPKGKVLPGVWKLLLQTAPQGKSENISPLLAGEVMRAILMGSHYPMTLLNALLQRIRVDHRIDYLRAGIIKGILVRNFNRKELTMALDENNTDVAYRLGRLFAVLEKAQEDAIPGANSTIKDRFFSSAASCPRSVFPLLIRLNQHHIRKTGNHFLDKQIETIVREVHEFPSTLTLEKQGLFALGYYHQRNNLYTKKENKKE